MAEITAVVILLVSGVIGAVVGCFDQRDHGRPGAVWGAVVGSILGCFGSLVGLGFLMLAVAMLRELGL